MKESQLSANHKNSISKKIIPGTVAIALFIISLVLFIVILGMVFLYHTTSFDQKMFQLTSPHVSECRTRLMLAVSFLGNHSFLIPANILLISFFLFIKNKRAAILVTAVALSSLGLMSSLKNLFRRHRPDNPFIDGITNFSFPSGHALMSVAFYGLLIWWAAISIKNKWQRWIIIAFLLFLILAIGFSRIYLRVHYTTDVMAGFCLGTAWLLISFWIITKFQARQA